MDNGISEDELARYEGYEVTKGEPAVVYQDQRYRGNGEHKWEGVVRALDGHPVSRLRVPGGWLYRDDKTGFLAYVPMPAVVKHKV